MGNLWLLATAERRAAEVKKIFPIMLVLMLLLWGCSKEEPQQVSSPPESAGTENAAESANDGGIRLMG